MSDIICKPTKRLKTIFIIAGMVSLLALTFSLYIQPDFIVLLSQIAFLCGSAF